MMKEKSLETNKQLQLPGVPEIAVCFITYVVVILAAVRIINALVPSNTPIYGLSFSALSALSGTCAFITAFYIRIRTKVSFGLCRTSVRWLLTGVGFGVGVFILAKICGIIYFMLGGTITNIQEPYTMAATGGTLSFIMQLILIAIATPIGEELAFRGVLASALQRFGPFVCIFGSSLIFALAHGLNEVFIAAFITGLATSYLYYRTKSIWPGVIVHMVNNALGTILSVLLATLL